MTTDDAPETGLHHGILHVIRHSGTPEVVMLLPDADARIVRLTFAPDGTVHLPAATRFRPDQLEVVAGKCPEAEDLWRRIKRDTPDAQA